jgi:hypothetical protein
VGETGIGHQYWRGWKHKHAQRVGNDMQRTRWRAAHEGGLEKQSLRGRWAKQAAGCSRQRSCAGSGNSGTMATNQAPVQWSLKIGKGKERLCPARPLRKLARNSPPTQVARDNNHQKRPQIHQQPSKNARIRLRMGKPTCISTSSHFRARVALLLTRQSLAASLRSRE